MATIRLSDIAVYRNTPGGPSRTRVLGQGLFGSPSRGFCLEHLNLTIPHGTTMVVLGPSGCGKTTLLRIISGLEQPDAGKVLFNGNDVRDIPPGQRKIGMLFQSYALYPHFTSRENITSYFMFKKRSPQLDQEKEQKFRRTSELLDVDISYLLDRRPGKLSGGEKQRVALSRCITRDPNLFLLDEPFSNLDAKLRVKYRLHLRTLLREFNITTVYVTHDQTEAILLADYVAIMRMETSGDVNRGSVEQMGTVRELYEFPETLHVADFLNFNADVPSISFLNGEALHSALKGRTLGIRPEDLLLADTPESGAIEGRIVTLSPDPLGQHQYITLHTRAGEAIAKVNFRDDLKEGGRVGLRFRKVHVFDSSNGIRAEEPRDLAQALGLDQSPMEKIPVGTLR